MTKEITKTRLYNITLFYLERFEASSLKVENMLNRRVQKERTKGNIIPENVNTLIHDVVLEMQRLGYINDNRYLQNQIRNLSNAGKSQSFILNKLKQDGFSTTIVKDLLSAFDQESESSDLTRANKWLKKHRKGQFRNKDATLFYQKDLAALARAGFSYDTAKKALTTQTESDDDYFINQ